MASVAAKQTAARAAKSKKPLSDMHQLQRAVRELQRETSGYSRCFAYMYAKEERTVRMEEFDTRRVQRVEAMKRARDEQEEDDKEKEEPRDESILPDQISGRRWQDIPRNAKLTEAETLTFFSEFKSAGELTDENVIERCNFLVRHAPPNNYLSLKIKGKFVQLIKRLEKVDPREHCLSRDDCLQPSGVVWKTGEEIEAAGRDCFPEDVMICTIDKDLFKLWPLLSFMQGIGTLHQVDGRAIDLGRKIMHLLDELGKKYPALATLLDPPTVIFNLQAMKINPGAVVIPPGLAPGNVPAFPGAVGIWTCPSELRAVELIGHLRATLAPILLPGGVAPRFHYFNAPMQNL